MYCVGNSCTKPMSLMAMARTISLPSCPVSSWGDVLKQCDSQKPLVTSVHLASICLAVLSWRVSVFTSTKDGERWGRHLTKLLISVIDQPGKRTSINHTQWLPIGGGHDKGIKSLSWRIPKHPKIMSFPFSTMMMLGQFWDPPFQETSILYHIINKFIQ